MFTWLTLAGDAKIVTRVSQEALLSPSAAIALGRRLAARRDEQGLTQEELAHRVGISRNHIQLLELGLSDRAKRSPANPRLSTLIALCQALGGRLVIDVNQPTAFTIEFDELPGHTCEQ